MAPKQKQSKRGRGYTPDLPPQIKEWLHDDEASRRFGLMEQSNIFPGAFVKYEELSGYGIREVAREADLESLLDFSKNDLKINHLLVKLFYANMGLSHHNPQRREDCVWTKVCGTKIWLPLQLLGTILECPSTGMDLEEVEVNMDVFHRDQIKHMFLSDDIRELRSTSLRPQARIVHRALIQSVTPRTGSYEEVRKENLQALYSIYGGNRINWGKWILTGFMDVNNRRRYRTLHYGAYIMRILNFFKVRGPESVLSRVKEVGSKTLSLMGLEKHPQSLDYISYRRWVQNKDQGLPQPAAPVLRGRRRAHEIVEEGEEEGPVEVVSPEATIREALITISRNQSKIEHRQIKHEKKTGRRFESIRKFLNVLREAASCGGASSSQAIPPTQQPPAPFQWSSSGNNGDDEEEEESNEESSEI